ncbi:MAG: DUF3899 domain-containing protein [Bacilli bacterium]
MENKEKRRIDKGSLIYIGITFAIGVAIFLVTFFTQGISVKSSLDGSFVAFAVLLLVGLLSLVASFGFFDFASYSFYYVFATFKKEKKYNDLNDYKQEKDEKRKKTKKNYLYYFISSTPFLIATIILRIVWQTLL